MTKRECAIITAYTETSMLKGADLKYLYDYLSKFIGRQIFTHEIPAVCTHFRDQIRADFVLLCENAVEETDK